MITSIVIDSNNGDKSIRIRLIGTYNFLNTTQRNIYGFSPTPRNIPG
jgi:hypothetical protein